MTKRVPLVFPVLVWLAVFAGCGSQPPAAAPEPTPPPPTPTPQPTPPPRPLSVVPTCPLSSSRPASPACGTHPSQHRDVVNAALDRVLDERPDLFNLEDVNGSPRVVRYDDYMVAVAAAIGEVAGYCAEVGPEGEIGVKNSNSFSEQWSVMTSANYLRRHYIGDCIPATF